MESYAIDESVVFFQAEDGIRDIGVTGVQTCALPILQPRGCRRSRPPPTRRLPNRRTAASTAAPQGPPAWSDGRRSRADRKSVVQGKSVDLGGRRIIKKKTRALRVGCNRERAFYLVRR